MRALKLFLAVALCVLHGSASTIFSKQSLAHRVDDPHKHILLFGSLLKRIAPQVRIRKVKIALDEKPEIDLVNSNGTYRAFIIHHSHEMPSERLYIANLQTGEVIEIINVPFPYRPFDDLVWINNQVLVFDRWTNPHYGIHYAFDAKRERLAQASPFPDEWYLEQQKPSPRVRRVRK